ncbi:MAG TPA: TlpA disulfide reductase family protein [Thermoanaerobaculia bacterium]|jgi:thiol-disulfide isomerase/thioredoxin|nr:TlpA disulfide reductase family protein [Thermoanaerobaculia bacterium]
MKRIAVALLVLTLACTPPRPRNRYGLAVDPDLRGAPVTLLHFWAAWCGPCRQELPRFTAFAAEHHMRVVAVSLDHDYASAERFLREQGITLETLIDDRGRFAAANHVRVIPTTIAYDVNGKLIDRFDQSVDWSDPAVARRVIR